jgi:lysyl-tRNA synthetase class 2
MRLRAQILQDIRHFFADRSVLEVETPILGNAIGADPQLAFFETEYTQSPLSRTLFLQTSPEFAMKRLLAAGSGSIYQICKAFRQGESGRFHNPEFTLLEWYRVGFNLSQLMDEVDELFCLLFKYHALAATQRVSYQAIFQQYTGLDPLQFCFQDYSQFAIDSGWPEAINICGQDPVLWLDFLFSHAVQPHIGTHGLTMVYGYPACQSSLARINEQNPAIADRVELFINGVELGNGYYELTDALEQNARFDREISLRLARGLPIPAKDERLIAALSAGFPACSGIAIGLDRLLMLLSGNPTIADVLSFPVDMA